MSFFYLVHKSRKRATTVRDSNFERHASAVAHVVAVFCGVSPPFSIPSPSHAPTHLTNIKEECEILVARIALPRSTLLNLYYFVIFQVLGPFSAFSFRVTIVSFVFAVYGHGRHCRYLSRKTDASG